MGQDNKSRLVNRSGRAVAMGLLGLVRPEDGLFGGPNRELKNPRFAAKLPKAISVGRSKTLESSRTSGCAVGRSSWKHLLPRRSYCCEPYGKKTFHY